MKAQIVSDISAIVSIIGILLGLASMQAAWGGWLSPGETGSVRIIRRVGLVVLTFAFGLTVFQAAEDTYWSPSLPFIVMQMSIDMLLGASLITALVRFLKVRNDSTGYIMLPNVQRQGGR